MVTGLARRVVLFFFLLSSLAMADQNLVSIYPGFGTPEGVYVEGRVLKRHRGPEMHPEDGQWTNLVRTSKLFFNRERKHQPVSLEWHGETQTGETDQEGFFHFQLTAPATQTWISGWQPVSVHFQDTVGAGQVLVVPPQNTLGLISDIDDTIMVSDVLKKRRLLAHTFLKNATQRQAVSGMVGLYQQVMLLNPEPEATPLFYLSAAPRQLFEPISAFLVHNGFPRGVLINKRVTDDQTRDPIRDQVAYKRQKIEAILERLPHVQFILVGDDGEKDPETYHAISEKYPDRVLAVWIRHIHPDPARVRFAEQQDLAKILAQPLQRSSLNIAKEEATYDRIPNQ